MDYLSNNTGSMGRKIDDDYYKTPNEIANEKNEEYYRIRGRIRRIQSVGFAVIAFVVLVINIPRLNSITMDEVFPINDKQNETVPVGKCAVDTDGDKLPDVIEIEMGLNPDQNEVSLCYQNTCGGAECLNGVMTEFAECINELRATASDYHSKIIAKTSSEISPEERQVVTQLMSKYDSYLSMEFEAKIKLISQLKKDSLTKTDQ